MIEAIIFIGVMVQASFPFPGPGTASSALTLWTTSVSGGSAQNFNGTIGCKISVGGSSIAIKEICRYCTSGNSEMHTLYLSDASGGDIANATVDMSGCSTGTFVCTAMVQTLAASTDYLIGTGNGATGDQYTDDTSTLGVTGVASINISAYAIATGGFGGYLTNSSGKCYGPVSFKY